PAATVGLFFFFMRRPPPRSTPFPYTTLFRSAGAGTTLLLAVRRADECAHGPRCGRDVAPGRGDRGCEPGLRDTDPRLGHVRRGRDRKSTRLNSSHVKISYAVFCLKKKKKIRQ